MIQSPDEGAQPGINIVMASNAPLAAILGLTEQTYVEGRRKNTQRDLVAHEKPAQSERVLVKTGCTERGKGNRYLYSVKYF